MNETNEEYIHPSNINYKAFCDICNVFNQWLGLNYSTHESLITGYCDININLDYSKHRSKMLSYCMANYDLITAKGFRLKSDDEKWKSLYSKSDYEEAEKSLAINMQAAKRTLT